MESFVEPTHRMLSASPYGRIAALLIAVTIAVSAAPPDLTNGGVPGDTISFNMGPTGARGWVYHVRENSSESRQIQIKSVAASSPAAGILAADDVILGASGTGAEPVNFTSDARKSLGLAIGDAEARNPAILKLIRWRTGATSTVTLTLQHMGAYSATAPYNCPKSALILQQGLAAIMSGETAGRSSFGTIGLLAGNNPADPNNAARIARARNEARLQIPSAAVMQQMMSDQRDTASPWQRGHTLIMLAEYYLLTRDDPTLDPDDTVLPAIEAYAVNIARNSSLFGTMGHIYATKNPDGSDNGPMGGVYGPVNSSGMPCFLGLLLARECGITHPTIEPAITRMSRFYAYYAGRGAVPYGEHEAYWQRHESNGKGGLAAICFHLLENRAEEGKFNAKMAVAATTEREMGHTGAFFNYLWSPLGAAAGGEQAAASHFSGIRWMLDLNRRWDGRFDYDCLNGEGPNSGSQYNDFRMSTAALLVYALPLRQLRITGKNHDSNRFLTSNDVTEAAAVDGYDPVPRTTSQLIADLGNWSPMVQRRAAEQLATRIIDTSTLNQITALANDPNGGSRIGACYTLGRISNSATANTRAATLAALLTDPENHVRFMAAEAMRYLPDSAKLSQLNAILSAAASTAKPLMPFDEEDPLQFAHGRLAMLLFYSGNAYGPKGVIWGSKINSPTVINRSLLYPAIRAVAANPVGQARSCLTETYRNLTAADVNALAGSIVDSVRFGAPSDKMFNGGVRMGGLDALEKFKKAEGVPLSMIYMIDDTRGDAYTYGLNVLKKYGGGSKTVTPDPGVVEFCQSLLGTAHAAAAQEVINLIAANSNPPPLTPFKSIQTVTADAPSLNLPSTQTTLRANATDLAEGDLVFTWRKIHGAGNVTFTSNGTAAAKNCAIQYASVPGKYLFEVTVTDSRGLTEVYGTVATTLRNPDGTLPPNSPPTAQPQTVNAIPGGAKPITLTGTDPEGYPLVFNVTSQPANGKLTGTAPNLIYTADIFHTGADSFTFEAMDSEGQTASATISINVSTANAELVIHEPFDYAAGGLNGKTGASEIGFAAPWLASTAQVVANSLSHGSLPVSGGSIGNLNGGSNNFGGTRALNASSLAQKGLLNDGATLWFSVIMGYGTNYAVNPPVAANLTNARLALALANSGFNTGNYKYYINDEGSQLGSGIGVTLGRVDGKNGKVVATHFRDASEGTSGWDGNVFGNVPVSTLGANSHRLVIGKITWGAAKDIIELYEPDTNMNLNLPTSTLEVNVDQAKFDTITWERGDIVTMDEIRFGDSLAAVVGLDLTPPDTDPPTLIGIVNDRGGETAQLGDLITYSLTFSEPMDTATIEAGDFGNAGTAAIAIQSVIQPLPHVVLVQVKPTTSGTLQFHIQEGALLTDLAGNPLDTNAAILDDTVITVNPAMVDVPFVLGISQTDAENAISGAGLAIGNVTTQHDPAIPTGMVISQDPAGGETVEQDSLVALVVSLGSEMAIVPSVVGLSQSAAQDVITTAGLTVGSVAAESSDTVPAGEVIRQNPEIGTAVTFNTTVDFVVSLGATDGTWNANSGGDWSDANNWLDNIVASGTGKTATISMTGTGDRTIRVDSDRSIGHITRNWAANNILTLAGTHTLTLAGPSPTITHNDPGAASRMEITAPLTGTDGLGIAGGGMVWLRNYSTNYSGPTIINGFLNFDDIANANISGGASAGRNITLHAGSAVRFNALSNSLLNRIVETGDEIVIMSGSTGNALDFSSSTGANLPNAFLGNWASNGGKMDYTGTITPASDHYRFGSSNSNGLLTIASDLGGSQGILIGGNRVQLSGTNTHTGSTFVGNGARLVLANGNAMQNSPLETGTPSDTGLLTLSDGTGGSGAAGTGALATPNPILGGLIGSRDLSSIIDQGNATATTHGSAGNNTGTLALDSITGITLNPGEGITFTYSGSIANIPGSSTAFALTKTGPGIQVLSGSHSHTGATEILDGTLAFNGGSMTSPITVEEGASIGFTLDSTTTSTSTVDLTEGTVKITGTVDNASDYLLMTAAAGITGTPTLDEPIPGYELQVNGTGTQLVLAYVGSGTPPFATWSGGLPADQDSNGDGVLNGVAWALGAANPGVDATVLLPTLDNTSDSEYVLFIFQRSNAAAADTGTTITVEYDTDLAGPWTTAVHDGDNVIIAVTDGTPTDTVVVKLKRSTLATTGRLFARLNVEVAD
jgi:autotransporter-associated beta strand protein